MLQHNLLCCMAVKRASRLWLPTVVVVLRIQMSHPSGYRYCIQQVTATASDRKSALGARLLSHATDSSSSSDSSPHQKQHAWTLALPPSYSLFLFCPPLILPVLLAAMRPTFLPAGLSLLTVVACPTC